MGASEGSDAPPSGTTPGDPPQRETPAGDAGPTGPGDAPETDRPPADTTSAEPAGDHDGEPAAPADGTPPPPSPATADDSDEPLVSTDTTPHVPASGHAPPDPSPAPAGPDADDRSRDQAPDGPPTAAPPGAATDDDGIPPAPALPGRHDEDRADGADTGRDADTGPPTGTEADVGPDQRADDADVDADTDTDDADADDEAPAVVLGGAAAIARTTGPTPRLPSDAAAATEPIRLGDDTALRPRSAPPPIQAPTARRDPTGEEPRPRHFRPSGAGLHDRDRRRVLIATAGPLVVFLLLIVGWAVDSVTLSGQVVRNVEVAGRPVGGLGEASLPDVMDEIADEVAARPVRLVNGDRTYETTAGDIGLVLDEEATAEAALDAGRSDSLLVRPIRWFGSFFGSRSVPVQYSVSEAAVASKVFEFQTTDAASEITAAAEPQIELQDGSFAVVPGRPGSGIDPREVVAELPEAAEEAEEGAIEVVAENTAVEPKYSDQEAREEADRVNEMTADGLTITAGETETRVEAQQLRGWIYQPPDEFEMTINPLAVVVGLQELFGAGTEAENATVEIAGGAPRVVAAKEGVVCCEEDSSAQIWEAVVAGETEVTLEMITAEPEVTTEEVEAWGIKEPIGGSRGWQNGADIAGPGPGFTTFHDCCESRVTNIHRMADLVDGAVIPPGGSFSINGHVGERTTGNGFIEAGAIREGRHVPEVGGGVSQFATTLFNAAYFAGLDITTYQAHTESFARYPRGREATMGFPNPDLVIENTTPHGILITTSYTGTSLTVTMWSTPYATAEQVGPPNVSMSGLCEVVSTTRLRTYPDKPDETDTFRATYRPGEGIGCDGPLPPLPGEEAPPTTAAPPG